MNRKIGLYSSAVNVLCVAGFAVAMLVDSSFASYLLSIGIAFSFVAMMSAFAHYSPEHSRAAGYCAAAFGAMYAVCNMIVYYIQITVVRSGGLTAQAASLLDFQQFGLMFNLDMLGYCLMAVSTFFCGLTLEPGTSAGRWLKGLLMIHGLFAISCFVVPLLGMFGSADPGSDWIGVAVLEFWCLYFIPIGILSMNHFYRTHRT